MNFVGIGASLALVVASADALAQSVQLIEKPGHVTEGRVIVDATPSEVYSLVTGYGSWPAFLSDVSAVHVESGGREDAQVRFKSKALKNTVTVQFNNQPDK